MVRQAIAGLLLAVPAGLLHATPAPHEISFSQAVAQALSDNPQVVASRWQVRASQGQMRSARGRGLPSLRLQLAATRSNDPLAVLGFHLQQQNATFGDLGLSDYTGPDAIDTAPAGLNQPGYANNFNTAVIVNLPLYAGGGNKARLQAAQAQNAAASANDSAVRAQLIFTVLSSYNGVLATEHLLLATQAAEQAASRNLASARSLFKRGVVIESDVMTAQAHWLQAGAALQAAQAAHADALDFFRTTIGASLDAALRPAQAVTVPVPALELAALQAQALKSNPQLQALREQVAARDAQRRIAQAAQRPRVDIVARHDWQADTPDLRAPSNTIMGVVSWDVFSSGAQSGAVDSATAQWQAAQAELAAAENALRQDTAQRYRALQSASSQARAAISSAQQAAQAARLLASRYDQGLSPLDSLLDAQARRNQARAQAVQAAHRAVLARAALLLALNQLDPARAVAQDLLPANAFSTLSSAPTADTKASSRR